MQRRILIILGHPDGRPERLCRALADAYAEGARSAGHEVRLIDVATLGFPLLRSMEDFAERPLPVTLEDAAQAIETAEHIVFVFPLWLGTMPALIEATVKDRLVLLRGIDLAGEVEQVKLRATQAGREAFERDEAAQKQAAEEFAAMPR